MHIERKLHIASMGGSAIDKDIYADQLVWDEIETFYLNDAVSYLTPVVKNYSFSYILIATLQSYPIDWKVKNGRVLKSIQKKYSISIRNSAENIVDAGNCAVILACGCVPTEEKLIELLFRESPGTWLFLSNQEYDAKELLELLSNNAKKLPQLSADLINSFNNKNGVLISLDSWAGESTISVFYKTNM